MNYIVLGSLSMSVVGLLLIYIAAANVEPEVMELDEITGELVGRTVTTEGLIKSTRTHENGHLFLTIADGGKVLQVPIFSSVMQHLDERSFKSNLKMRVTGLVDEYRGQVQVVPRKPEDVILGYSG